MLLLVVASIHNLFFKARSCQPDSQQPAASTVHSLILYANMYYKKKENYREKEGEKEKKKLLIIDGHMPRSLFQGQKMSTRSIS